MKYTDNEMCVIVLCSYIGVDSSFGVKPLSQGEWNKFLAALLAAQKEPKIIYDLSDEDAKSLGYDPAFAERIRRLADRGAAVGFELQEYERKGIQVITEINEHYPVLLRRRLGKKKPPVLFYAGDIGLAGKIGIAFQIQDDILDVTGTMEELGKAVGSDEKNHKTTYVTLEGIKKAGEDVKELTKEALNLLMELPGEQEFLRELLLSLCTRRK